MPPDLGYPENDYNKSGPRPTTFSVRQVFPSIPFPMRFSHHVEYVFPTAGASYCLVTFQCVSQGQRALDFVLRNQGLIDKTLLFDIELLKIMPN